MRHTVALLGLSVFIWLTPVMPIAAQAPAPPGPSKPDSPDIQQRLSEAKTIAGGEWAEAFEFICAMNPSRVNRPDDPEIAPTKVFDNLFVIGRSGTAVWTVTTSAGIVLIDAGYADQLETVLLPGMKKLGLDPARVTHVLLGHGHADHFGGASYFQQRGARIAMAGPDWDLVEAPAPAARGAAPTPVPKRDLVAAEGQPLRVGDITFTPVLIPGHTPGSMGFIFPVKDGGSTRMAALFGGSILTPGRLTDEGLRQYIASVDHWAQMTRQMKVEVEIQNHPLYDGFLTKLERLSRRKPGEPNPFVVGTDAYQRFLRVMSGCTAVQLARRSL